MFQLTIEKLLKLNNFFIENSLTSKPKIIEEFGHAPCIVVKLGGSSWI
jgi:hypothetical protein